MATPVKKITALPAAPAALMTHVVPAVDPALASNVANQKLTLAQIWTLFINQLPPVYASDYGMATTANAATNTTALNAAINVAAINGGARVMLPRGVCDVNALNPPAFNNVVITGQGRFQGSTLRFMNATGDCIPLGTWAHLGIEDVYITAGVRRTSGWAIRVYNGAFTPAIRNIRIDYHFNGILVESAGDAIVENITYRYMYGNRYTQLGGVTNGVYRTTLRDQRGDNPMPTVTYGPVKTRANSTLYNYGDIISVNGKVWQQTANPSGTTGVGTAPNAIPGTTASDGFTTQVADGTARWQFVYDASLIHCLIDSYAYSTYAESIVGLNGLSSVYVTDSLNAGASTTHPIWMWFTDIEADHNFGDGVVLWIGEGFRGINSWFGSSLTNNGMTIGPNFKGEVTLDTTRILGNWFNGITWYPGPSNVRITNCDIGHNSVAGVSVGHGITMVNGITQGMITDCFIGKLAVAGWLAAPNNQGYGIYGDVGPTNNVTIALNDLRNNQLGGLFSGFNTPNNNIIRLNQGVLDSGTWEQIKTIDPVGLTAADFLFDATKYIDYRIRFHGIKPTPNADYFSIRVTRDGVNWDSGATDYWNQYETAVAGYPAIAEFADLIGYIDVAAQDPASNYPCAGEVLVPRPEANQRCVIMTDCTTWHSTPTPKHYRAQNNVHRDLAAPILGIRIYWWGGNAYAAGGNMIFEGKVR